MRNRVRAWERDVEMPVGSVFPVRGGWGGGAAGAVKVARVLRFFAPLTFWRSLFFDRLELFLVVLAPR